LKIVQRWGGGIHMNRWRVGENRGSKEMDGCPLTVEIKAKQGWYPFIEPESLDYSQFN
jgi:hypothetical protein